MRGAAKPFVACVLDTMPLFTILWGQFIPCYYSKGGIALNMLSDSNRVAELDEDKIQKRSVSFCSHSLKNWNLRGHPAIPICRLVHYTTAKSKSQRNTARRRLLQSETQTARKAAWLLGRNIPKENASLGSASAKHFSARFSVR